MERSCLPAPSGCSFCFLIAGRTTSLAAALPRCPVLPHPPSLRKMHHMLDHRSTSQRCFSTGLPSSRMTPACFKVTETTQHRDRKPMHHIRFVLENDVSGVAGLRSITRFWDSLCCYSLNAILPLLFTWGSSVCQRKSQGCDQRM